MKIEDIQEGDIVEQGGIKGEVVIYQGKKKIKYDTGYDGFGGRFRYDDIKNNVKIYETRRR